MIKTTLQLMQIIIIYLPDKEVTCTRVRQIWSFFKRAYYVGITIFNSLPTEIKALSYYPKKFKIALKPFFSHSFYTPD